MVALFQTTVLLNRLLQIFETENSCGYIYVFNSKTPCLLFLYYSTLLQHMCIFLDSLCISVIGRGPQFCWPERQMVTCLVAILTWWLYFKPKVPFEEPTFFPWCNQVYSSVALKPLSRPDGLLHTWLPYSYYKRLTNAIYYLPALVYMIVLYTIPSWLVSMEAQKLQPDLCH